MTHKNNSLRVSFFIGLALVLTQFIFWDGPFAHADSLGIASDQSGEIPRTEIAIRETLTDEYINRVIAIGLSAEQLEKIYGPPLNTQTKGNLTVTSYNPFFQKDHIIPPKTSGRIGFVLVKQDGKVVKWTPVDMMKR